MRRILVALAPVFCGAVISTAQAEEFFVASDGNDAAAGSMQAPFATVERAQEAAASGDTVWIRGGEYHFSGTTRAVGVSFTKSGAADRPIHYFAYANEIPVFDLFDLKPQERVTGLDVRCNWIHLRGLEVRGVRQLIVGDSWGVRIRGDHNVIERLHVHDNEAPGVFIASGASNLVLNCDSHNNYDPLEDGGNGDGFGCHSNGGDNVLRGCRSWSNSDDGFDFINAPGSCTVEHSWSFKNGYVPNTMTAAGNGAGFKSGGFGSPPNIPSTGVPRHVVRFNLAFRNRSQGFYANHHPGGLDFLNNTAFANGVNFDMLVEGGQSTHQLHNNIATGSGGTVMRFTGGDDSDNSWNLPVMVSDADFLSMDETEVLAPRQADGSLPVIKFMHLAAGSDLIDRGMQVGLQFAGNSPDLGAFEFGAGDMTGASDAGTPDLGTMDASMAAMSSAGAGAAGSGSQQPSGAAGNASSAPAGSAGHAGMASNAGAAGSGTSTRITSSAGTTAAGGGAPAQTASAATQASSNSEGAPAASSCSCRIGQNGQPARARSALWLCLALFAWLQLRAGRRRAKQRSTPRTHSRVCPLGAAPCRRAPVHPCLPARCAENHATRTTSGIALSYVPRRHAHCATLPPRPCPSTLAAGTAGLRRKPRHARGPRIALAHVPQRHAHCATLPPLPCPSALAARPAGLRRDPRHAHGPRIALAHVPHWHAHCATLPPLPCLSALAASARGCAERHASCPRCVSFCV